LARVELFAGLDRLVIAQVAAYLEPLVVEQGVVLFSQGDAADSLYIVASGELGVFTRGNSAPTETRLNTLFAGDSVGEMAMLTGEQRSASIRALSRSTVLRLAREPFLEVVAAHPPVAQAVISVLSMHLRVADKARLESDTHTQHTVDAILAELDPDARTRVLEASLLPERSPEALVTLFGASAEEVAANLAKLGIRMGQASSAVQRILMERLTGDVGPEELKRLSSHAAEVLAAGRCWDEALAIVAALGEHRQLAATLGRALRSVPPLPAERAARWLDRLPIEDASDDVEVALASAARAEERGDIGGATALLQRALGQALLFGDAATGQRLTSAIARVSRDEDEPVSPMDVAPEREGRPGARRGIAGVAAALALTIAAAAVPAGSPQISFLLLLGAALSLWSSRLFPHFAVSLLLAAAWIIWGIANPSQAVAGFASMDWIFVLAVLAIAVAIEQSGLLFRAGLLLTRRMPRRLVWQGGTLLLTGLLLSPLLPEERGRAALTGPLALTLAQAARLRNNSAAAAALGLAAWIGSAPLSFAALNASSVSLLAWGLLPAPSRQQFDWLSWLLAALPLVVILAVGAFVAAWVVLRPDWHEAPSREGLDLQLAVLGPLSRREMGMILVLVVMVAGWSLAPLLHLHVAVIAVLGLFGAVVTGSFDQRSFREMDWSFLIYYGVALSVGALFNELQVGTLFSHLLGGGGRLATGGELLLMSPLLFIFAVASVGLAARFVLAAHETVLLLSLLFGPLAVRLGIDPWIVAVTLLAVINPWLTARQTPAFQVAFSATRGRLYTEAQARKVAVAYTVVTFLGLGLTIPFWRAMGLL